MSYTDFFTLIKRNTRNHLDDYKGLCRFCLQNISHGIDISEDNYNTNPQKDAILNNHVIITKQYLPISPEYPNLICTSCESNLNDYALFVQQIEQNAENWEMFLKSNSDVKFYKDKGDFDEYKPLNGIEEIKIEYNCDDIEITDTSVYDALDTSLMYSDTKNGIVPIEVKSPSHQMNDLNDKNDNMTSRQNKRCDKYRPKLFHVNLSTEYERTCKLCNEPTFTSLARFYKHQRQQHPGEKSFTCDICGSKFNNKSRLGIHMTDRHAKCGKKHQCQFCAKLFFSDREVKGHEKLHLNARSYICKLCGKGFNQKTILNIHLKSKVHNAEYKTLPKKKTYKSYKSYKSKNRFRCELCIPTMIFPSVEERAFHRNSIHKTYECDICKNSFMAQESLDCHKLLHSDKPRPFICTVCNASFNQSSHLTSHFKRKHTAEKSFHCPHCDKSFFESCELNAHVRLVHRKQKRVKCDKCDCDFATEKYLQKHVLQKHSTEASPYDCKICGKRNENGLKLDVHRLKHHKQ